MENRDLIARATVRMKKLLAEPEIQGDQKRALHAACAIIEIIIDQVRKDIDGLLPEAHKPTTNPTGHPKAEDNPIRITVKETGYIAAIWAKYHGISNANEAAKKYLTRLLGTSPNEKLVSNLQRRISEARKDNKNNYLN